MRRVARFLSSVAILTGLLLLADAAVTLLWQEPLTAVIAMIRHDQIDKRFLSYRTAPLTRTDQLALDRLGAAQRMAFLARREESKLRTGDAAGKITASKIGISFLFVQRSSEARCGTGAGSCRATAHPACAE